MGYVRNTRRFSRVTTSTFLLFVRAPRFRTSIQQLPAIASGFCSHFPLLSVAIFHRIRAYMMDPLDIVGKTKEDASLPKVNHSSSFHEFINLVPSESNEVCNKEDKRAINPEHILKALQDLGFGEYIEEVYAAYEQHKLETVQDGVKSAKWSSSGNEMSEEEAAAAQPRMFAEARSRTVVLAK